MWVAPRQVTTTTLVNGREVTTSTIRPVPELVVIADQLLAPVPGGTGRYTAELLAALARTAPPGWSVAGVVCRPADPGTLSRAVVEGVAGPRVLPIPRRALIALWQAGVPWWPGGDSVHAPTPLAPPRAPKGAVLTVTVHDAVPWSHPHTLTPRGVRWHKAMIGRALRRADAVVVPTRSVAAALADQPDLAVCRAEVRVIPHGVARVFTPGGPAPADVSAHRLPEQFVLAVGTLEPRKGIDVLIDAVARLHRAGATTPGLVLAGQPGWGGLDPLALAEGHGLPDGTVRVLGRLPDAELAGVLRQAAALAVPSHAEGFGLPVLEAMSAGVPVIHSDAPALVEVAGGASLVVPRGDANGLAGALRRVFADPAVAAELVAAGRRRAAEFSWHQAAESVWALHLARWESRRQQAGG